LGPFVGCISPEERIFFSPNFVGTARKDTVGDE